MFCIKCGNQLPENSLFCPKCGSKVAESNTNISEEDNNTYQKVLVGQPGQSIPIRRKKTKAYILVGIAALTLIFGFFLWHSYGTVYWYESTGELIDSQGYFTFAKETPQRHLPSDEKWEYIKWDMRTDGNDITYVAVRQPSTEYLKTKVFQIITYDRYNQPLGTGSGVLISSTGQFVTNSHVMENAFYAKAYFDIKTKDSAYTVFDVVGTYIYEQNKDIYFGKLKNFKLTDSTKPLEFASSYSEGDKCYTAGYPNSSTTMQIAVGNVQGVSSSLYDKIYTGATYIESDAFVAPGSSGGALINDHMQVIGITSQQHTDDKGNFVSSLSLEADIVNTYKAQINKATLQDLAISLNSDEKTFIAFFKQYCSYNNVGVSDDKSEFEYEYEEEGVNSNQRNYIYKSRFICELDGSIDYTRLLDFEDDEGYVAWIEGPYSENNGIKNCDFYFRYRWSSGEWYKIKASCRYYNSDLQSTMKYYTKESSSGITISDGNLQYAKELYNQMYEWLDKEIKDEASKWSKKSVN